MIFKIKIDGYDVDWEQEVHKYIFIHFEILQFYGFKL